MSYLVFQRLALEFFWTIIYFPVWWYTKGAKRALDFCINLVKMGNKQLVPGLWLKNIFTPMFGQTDWQGRIVSFLIRVGNIIGRSIAMFIWFFVVLSLLIFWALVPIFTFVMLIISLI